MHGGRVRIILLACDLEVYHRASRLDPLFQFSGLNIDVKMTSGYAVMALVALSLSVVAGELIIAAVVTVGQDI